MISSKSLLVFILLFGASCVSVKPISFEMDEAIAERQVGRLHRLMNDKKYDEISGLINAPDGASREQFIQSLRQLRESAGSITHSKPIKLESEIQGRIRRVHMFFETEFETGKRFEEFVCDVDGNDGRFEFYAQPTSIP